MYRKIGLIILSAFSLTACVNDEYSGGTVTHGDGAIGFNNVVEPFSRAQKTGKDAATALGGKFYVYGIKNESQMAPGVLTDDNLVFKNYKVTYTDGSANSSTSNTSGWEYVGNTLTDNEATNVTDNIGTDAQLIKYWDDNASDYTFYAFAVANNDVENGKIKVDKINTGLNQYNNGYLMTLTADADPTQLYVSNRKQIMKGTNGYGTAVNLSFHNVMSKVRVAMYETIPGYSLTIDAFRIADTPVPTFGEMTTENTTNFAANLSNNKTNNAGLMYVTYNDNTSANTDEPVVNFSGYNQTYVLSLGNQLKSGTKLGTDASSKVYDTANGDYTAVYPMESNANNLKLKVDFTLTSSVGETIKVKDATVEVPAEYLRWRPGYAYTYVFKISDQTNATIGSLTGLYPITFDALDITDGTGKEEVISTTGTDVNIVTMGYDADTKLITVGQDDYSRGNTIYASFIEGKDLVTASANNTKLYVATTDDTENYPITESNVSKYLTAYATDKTLVDQPVTVYEVAIPTDDIVTTVPKGDGTDDVRMLSAMKWTAAKHVYAVEYTSTSNKKYYKIVKIDGFNGRTTGALTLSTDVINNTGGTITPSLTADGINPSNAEVTYTLDYDGKYGAVVPKGVIITDGGTDNVCITIPSGTAPTTTDKYTVIATFNRRTYKATFSVNQ